MYESNLNSETVLTLILIFFLVIQGCDYTSSPGTEDFKNDIEKNKKESYSYKTYDAKLAEIASEDPNFGGFYINKDGDPNIFLKDIQDQKSIEKIPDKLISKINAKSLKDKAKNDISIRKADFGFNELYIWKKALKNLLNNPNVVYIDINDKKNRIELGVKKGFDIKNIHSLAAKQNVDISAISIVETSEVNKLQTLRSRQRPTLGGIQVVRDSGGKCTLGYNVTTSSGYKAFVTASHCTNIQGGTENTEFYQPDTTNSSDLIGYEISDPNYSNNLDGCPSNRVCRYSDAALIRYYNTNDFEQGYISKTEFRKSNSPGSINMDGVFGINDEEDIGFPGTELQKVGRTSGWTYGNITNVCADYNVSGTNITLLCQNAVDGYAAHGDSGSPVFERDFSFSPLVTAHGVLWGGGSSSFIYSMWPAVEAELGQLNIRY